MTELVKGVYQPIIHIVDPAFFHFFEAKNPEDFSYADVVQDHPVSPFLIGLCHPNYASNQPPIHFEQFNFGGVRHRCLARVFEEVRPNLTLYFGIRFSEPDKNSPMWRDIWITRPIPETNHNQLVFHRARPLPLLHEYQFDDFLKQLANKKSSRRFAAP
jgi:hypothetical protein